MVTYSAGSVSTWTTTGPSASRASLRASASSPMVRGVSTLAPRLAALAARSTGSRSPSRPSASRKRNWVPKRPLPDASDSDPIEA